MGAGEGVASASVPLQDVEVVLQYKEVFVLVVLLQGGRFRTLATITVVTADDDAMVGVVTGTVRVSGECDDRKHRCSVLV